MSIHKPQSVSVEVSTDNVNYKKVGELHFTSEQSFREGNYVDDLTFKLKKTKARYVRFRAQGPGNCPVGHVRAGSESRVLFDEIIIN